MILALALIVLSQNPSPPPDASATRRGLINTTTQTFSGRKVFVDGGILADLQVGSTLAGGQILSAASAAQTFYVDPAGDDSGACLAPGVSACATISGGLTKVPLVIYSAVGMNVAPGTYSTALTWLPFTFGPSGSLTISGARANSTLATGSPTGTVTAFTGSAFGVDLTNRPTVTDSGQSWTTNDLRGRFFEVLTGTGAGAVVPITGNTATTLTLAGFASTAAGATYAIREPSVIVTPLLAMGGGNALGGVTLQDIELTGAGTRVTQASVGTLTLNRVRLTNTLGGYAMQAAGRLNILSSVLRNTGSGGCLSLSSSAANALLSTNTSFCQASPGAAQAGVFVSSKGFWSGVNLDMSVGAGVALQVSSGGWISASTLSTGGVRVECSGSTVALSLGGYPLGTTGSLSEPGNAFLNLGTQGCTTGVALANGSHFTSGALIINTATTGVTLTGASAANLSNSLPTFTSVTNEYVVDGTSQTSASVEALGTKVVQGALKSVLLRQ